MSDTIAEGTSKSAWRKSVFTVFAVVVALLLGVAISQLTRLDESGEPAEPPAFVQLPSSANDGKPRMRDSEPVIGVTLGDRHRAYILADLWAPSQHVLNDQFDETPVTVTFCDLDNCVKAFTDNTKSGKLELRNGGANPRKARRMLLITQGRAFEQDTLLPIDGDKEHPFPYQTVAAIRTTWGEWRADHPKTELRANDKVYAPGSW